MKSQDLQKRLRSKLVKPSKMFILSIACLLPVGLVMAQGGGGGGGGDGLGDLGLGNLGLGGDLSNLGGSGGGGE